MSRYEDRKAAGAAEIRAVLAALGRLDWEVVIPPPGDLSMSVQRSGDPSTAFAVAPVVVVPLPGQRVERWECLCGWEGIILVDSNQFMTAGAAAVAALDATDRIIEWERRRVALRDGG